MKISPNLPCPCHSGIKYKKCCRPYHDGHAAPTPETLMRSRYSAYALNRADHLMRTTHPDSPHRQANAATWRSKLEAFSTSVRFEGLAILAAEGDTVTFHATLFQGDRDLSYTEVSRFRRENEQWLYVEAVSE